MTDPQEFSSYGPFGGTGSGISDNYFRQNDGFTNVEVFGEDYIHSVVISYVQRRLHDNGVVSTTPFTCAALAACKGNPISPVVRDQGSPQFPESWTQMAISGTYGKYVNQLSFNINGTWYDFPGARANTPTQDMPEMWVSASDFVALHCRCGEWMDAFGIVQLSDGIWYGPGG